MRKNYNILIIGFGSIGKRHYGNLARLGFKNVSVYDIDRKQTAGKATINKLNRKNLEKFDVVFLCSPNHLHVKQALLCAKARCHLFIEKPLAHSGRNIAALEELCRRQKLTVLVACNLRFHPCIQFIKRSLARSIVGKVYSFQHEVGHYLPAWRPKQDYRKNYAAHKNMGGGIILDAIHEFDLLFWLNNWSDVIEEKFIIDKVSNLKIETEDIGLASFKFKNKVLGLIVCDYLQRAYTRRCKIVGEKGNIEWDFNKNIVWLTSDRRKNKLFEKINYKTNSMYIDEIKYFFRCVDKGQRTFNDIATAWKVLQSCLKKS